MEPAVANLSAFVDRDRVDDQRVALPARRLVAVEERLLLFLRLVRSPVGMDDAPPVVVLDQVDELPRLRDDLVHVGVLRDHARRARRAVQLTFALPSSVSVRLIALRFSLAHG